VQQLSDPGLRALAVQLGSSPIWPMIYRALQLENLLQPQASSVGKIQGKPPALAVRERQRKPCKVETQGREHWAGLEV